MFSKIAVALNDLPESQCALRMAIELTHVYNAELATASFLGDIPAYASFAIVLDPRTPNPMNEAIAKSNASCMNKHHSAREHGVRATGSIMEGREVEAILNPLQDEHADPLVIELHRHNFYSSRLWNSGYDLAQEAPCSVLGVH